jgi:hypothetical protein
MDFFSSENILLLICWFVFFVSLINIQTFMFLRKSINLILEYVIILLSLLFYILLTCVFLHTAKLIYLCLGPVEKIFNN